MERKLFYFILIIEAIMFLILMPVGRVPDDRMHFQSLQATSGFTGYNKAYDHFYRWSSIQLVEPNNDQTVLLDYYINVGMEENIGRLKFDSSGISPAFVKYVPAIIGLLICSIFNPPILIMTTIMRIMSFIFYIIMCRITLDVLPYKKEIFMFTMLIPMSIQQCTSISGDAVLIPCSFLFFALILKYREPGEIVGFKRVGILFLLLMIITISKVVYVMMGFTVFLIPLSRFDLRIKGFDIVKFYKRFIVPIWIALFSLIVLGLYLCRNIGYVKVLIASVLELPQTITLFINTSGKYTGDYIRSMIGAFGFMDVWVGWKFVAITAIIAIIISTFKVFDSDGYTYTKVSPFSKKARIWMITVMLATCAFIVEAHISWSFFVIQHPKEADSPSVQAMLSIYDMRQDINHLKYIVGVQGRYFIPVLPYTLMAISGDCKKLKKNYIYLGLAGFYLLVVVYIMRLLLKRYWI